MKELGQLREERKTLEHQISDLFALKTKYGGRDVSCPLVDWGDACMWKELMSRPRHSRRKCP